LIASPNAHSFPYDGDVSKSLKPYVMALDMIDFELTFHKQSPRNGVTRPFVNVI